MSTYDYDVEFQKYGIGEWEIRSNYTADIARYYYHPVDKSIDYYAVCIRETYIEVWLNIFTNNNYNRNIKIPKDLLWSSRPTFADNELLKFLQEYNVPQDNNLSKLNIQYLVKEEIP